MTTSIKTELDKAHIYKACLFNSSILESRRTLNGRSIGISGDIVQCLWVVLAIVLLYIQQVRIQYMYKLEYDYISKRGRECRLQNMSKTE